MKYFLLKSVFIFISFVLTALVAICQVGSKEDILSLLYKNEGEQFFCFQSVSQSTMQELNCIISFDKIDKTGKVYAYANKKGFSRFLDFGIPYQILPHPGDFNGFLNMKSDIDIRNTRDWDFYPTYEAYVNMMYQFEADYPELCQVFSIGTSVQGRELLVAKISDNVGIRENEPQFLYTSSIHGDELTGYILTLRLIDYLLSNYAADPRVTSLVDNMEIWINPLANPDGTYAGGNSTVNGARRFNANWIDLNRNYPDPEEGPHPDGEAWQTETIHFMDMASNNHFVSSTNFHGGSSLCNYPWDTWSRLTADDSWWQYVCHEYADTVHANCPWAYMADYDNGISNGYAWYRITGGRQDYMNYFQQDREFTLEISNTKLLEPDSLPYYWQYNYRSMLNYMEQSTFGIRGTVKDSVTGWPVRAQVYVVLHELDSSWVYSALPLGDYHRLLYAGNYTVKYSATGYIAQVLSNVSVTNHQATILDIKLVPDGAGGIENSEVNNLIQIFPNPLEGDILRIESGISLNQLIVYDHCGKEVYRKTANTRVCGINLQSLDSGLYFIRFETEKGPGIKKIIINH
jgi:hypothetical protein